MIKTKIDELLKENGLTFGMLAERINVKRTTLLYHLANPKIPLKYLIQIAQVLDIEVSELMTEEDVDIIGGVFLHDKYYDLNILDDFVAFTNQLSIDCGLESDLFYEQKKQELV